MLKHVKTRVLSESAMGSIQFRNWNCHLMVNFGIDYLKQKGIGIDKMGIEISYKIY